MRLKCVEDYRGSVPLNYQEKIYTGRSKTGFVLEIFGKKIFSYSSGNLYQNCDIITEIGQYCIGKNFYLPLLCERRTVREYTLADAVRTKEEAELCARQLLVRYLEEKKLCGAVILDKELAARFTKTKCILEGRLIFNESAWEYRRIKPEEWRFQSEDGNSTENN